MVFPGRTLDRRKPGGGGSQPGRTGAGNGRRGEREIGRAFDDVGDAVDRGGAAVEHRAVTDRDHERQLVAGGRAAVLNEGGDGAVGFGLDLGTP